MEMSDASESESTSEHASRAAWQMLVQLAKMMYDGYKKSLLNDIHAIGISGFALPQTKTNWLNSISLVEVNK
jgi:hypothetical protein